MSSRGNCGKIENSIMLLGPRSTLMLALIKKISQVIDWIMFGTLCIIAMISVGESWKAYLIGKTSWTIEHVPILNHPTFTLCFGLSDITLQYNTSDYYYLTLGKDFDMFFEANSNRYG